MKVPSGGGITVLSTFRYVFCLLWFRDEEAATEVAWPQNRVDIYHEGFYLGDFEFWSLVVQGSCFVLNVR